VQRVLVIGCPGAGKSTFARRLATQCGLPLVELDRAYWRPGWIATPREEWLPLVQQLCAAPAWVMDGNYSNSLPVRLACADTVIWLDYPRHICMRRVLARSIRNYGRVRDGLPEGCPDRLSMEFLAYVWNFPAKSRPRLIAALAELGPRVAIHKVISDRETEHLLADLMTTHPGSRPQPSLCVTHLGGRL
jgi:adenylate kinase family enzyme